MTSSLGIHLTPTLLAEIDRIGKERAPSEACGVLLMRPRYHTPESQVVELPNRSMRAHDTYEIYTGDMRIELGSWIHDTSEEEISHMAIWHTHPQGNIGPSGRDMKTRNKELNYLVVALTDTGPIPTWF